MSDEDEAQMFLQQEHMENYGHWVEGAIEVFAVDSKEEEKKLRAQHSHHGRK